MPDRSRAIALASLLLAGASLGGCSGYRGGSAYSLSERECLARAMYFESNRSSEDGMLAVGTVVMNRLQAPKYPKSLCGVVGEPRQFADGALSKPVTGAAFQKALKVADNVIAGDRHTGVGEAMHFHTAGYRFPYRNMYYVAAAGGNVFYEKRQPGTFVPVNPRTLVARAEPTAPRVEKVLLADASEEVPLPRFRSRSDADEEKPLRGPRRELAKAGREDDEAPAPRAKSRERTKVAALSEDEEAPRGRHRSRLAKAAAPADEDEAKPARHRGDRTRRAESDEPSPKHKGVRSEKTRLASAEVDGLPARPARGGTRTKSASLDDRPPAPPRRETGTRKDKDKDWHEPTAKARTKREKPSVAELKDLDLPPKR